MKNIARITIFLFLGFFLFPLKTLAYTINDVAEHNTSTDCWVIFEENVYDLSRYVPSHDRYMDIREWCGKDMTDDFKDKAGMNRDHRASSYTLLEQYNIGELNDDALADDEDTEISPIQEVNSEKEVIKAKGYNLVIPLFLSLIVYWIPYFLIKKQVLKVPITKFNAFWNTVLMLTLLIPSFGFGIFMMIRSKNPSLYNVNFDFIYWHVELSVVMGTIAICHFVQRIAIYLKQISSKSN